MRAARIIGPTGGRNFRDPEEGCRPGGNKVAANSIAASCPMMMLTGPNWHNKWPLASSSSTSGTRADWSRAEPPAHQLSAVSREPAASWPGNKAGAAELVTCSRLARRADAQTTGAFNGPINHCAGCTSIANASRCTRSLGCFRLGSTRRLAAEMNAEAAASGGGPFCMMARMD